MRAGAVLTALAALLAASCATRPRAVPMEAMACAVRMEAEVVNIVCGESDQSGRGARGADGAG